MEAQAAEETTDEPLDDSSIESIDEPIDELIDDISLESVDEPIDEPVDEPIDEPVDEPAAAEYAPTFDPPDEDEIPTDDSDNTETMPESSIDIAALQQRYLEVVGRATSSCNVSYVRWKIRQAERGKVPVGPIASRRSNAVGREFKVLPVRLESDLVDKIDEAWKRLGLKSRMDLFRVSLQSYLVGVGEIDLAEALSTRNA